mmetsp:Transcript_22626/g.57570  ORF Transcript_22626/g.57570 Transcript_22626/m.57570 type:complete len:91 (+) Transcript_22626:1457-1729(+)
MPAPLMAAYTTEVCGIAAAATEVVMVSAGLEWARFWRGPMVVGRRLELKQWGLMAAAHQARQRASFLHGAQQWSVITTAGCHAMLSLKRR